MFPPMSRTNRLATIVLAIGAAALAGWWGAQFIAPAERRIILVNGTVLAPSRAIDTFDLVDQGGRRFTKERLAGRWSVIYFGFTTCPMICPTTMAVLKDFAQRVSGLPANARPQVILITVDPEHDTPEAMGRYVTAFDPSFLGLTGSRTALDAVAAEFSVAHGPAPAGGTPDHSATIYFVDPQPTLTAVFTPPHSAAALADDYRRLSGRLTGRLTGHLASG
jgi:protein SCO1/2